MPPTSANDVPPAEILIGDQPGQRYAAERFRRIWQMIEDIAHQPGKSRKQLAAEFGMSERQIQSDLNAIRHDVGLPLVRRQGYRFATEASGNTAPFTLAEAHLLALLLRRATQDPTIPSDRLRSLGEKVPALLPVHLRHLVACTLADVAAPTPRTGSAHGEVLATLTEALLRKSYVRLQFASGTPDAPLSETLVQPEALLPYHRSWYLVGHCLQRRRTLIFALDQVTGVLHTGAP